MSKEFLKMQKLAGVITESQYNEIITIIQSNENYNNNILKYMDVSFNVVKSSAEILSRLTMWFIKSVLSNSLGILLIIKTA